MKTNAHQAKFGNSPLTSLMIELMKAMSHASYNKLWLALVFFQRRARLVNVFFAGSYNCNGYGSKSKWVADDVRQAEARA
jgi:hypothetical protein